MRMEQNMRIAMYPVRVNWLTFHNSTQLIGKLSHTPYTQGVLGDDHKYCAVHTVWFS